MRKVPDQIESGDLEGARATLEQERRNSPRSANVRSSLGEVYYLIAREALDRDRDEERYLLFLERSVNEFVTAIELDPRSDRPHFFLAVMDVYRGDLDRALIGFNVVRKLHPRSGVACTNIAEIYVYRGDTDKAMEWNDLGARRDADMGLLTFNDMLIAWKVGDMPRAHRHFATLRSLYPEMLQTINVARIPVPPRRFEDFAAYCCGSPACGPYMESGCKELQLEVQRREISKEAILRELRIEMEKQRRIRDVYDQHKELEIEPAPRDNSR